jgi:hypothetical protein
MQKTRQEKPPRKCHVVILTHEGENQHEQTGAGMLTQFFVDSNNVGTGVRTYVIDNAIGDRVVKLQPSDNYCKKLCSVPHLQNVQWLPANGAPTPVIFIQCHGSPASDADPPCLAFSELAETNRLYPCAGYSDTVWLHHVIRNTNLVFLLCCHCDQIVPAYLAERTNDFPDIVYFNCGPVLHITVSIFIAWLIQMIDSSKAIGHNPQPHALYRGVQHSVVGILSIVHQCTDADDFFDYLLQRGCLTKYTTEKEKEDQAVPTWRVQDPNDIQHFYRVYGHTKNEFIPELSRARLFREFQTLTLLEAGKDETPPVYTTHASKFVFATPHMHNTDNVCALLSQLKLISLSS